MQVHRQRSVGRRIFAASIAALALQASSFVCVAPAAAAGTTAAPKKGPSLRRADFRVEGASCVVCLRRIAKTFKETKGVLKADVSVYRPYWSLIIYDSKETNWQKITDRIKDEKVKLVELEDKPISQVPVIVIPKGLSQTDGRIKPSN